MGVWTGKSIAFDGGFKRSMGDVFLVVNPSEEELVIKESIMKSLEENENKRKEKKSLSTIPLSKMQVGGIYKCNNGILYIYLGNRKVTIANIRYNNVKVEEGNCFVYVGYKDKSIEDIKGTILGINPYHTKHNINIIKGNKKLTELIRKVDLEFPMTNEVKADSYSRYSSSYHIKLTIE